jgi:RNA polymerase sigma-70 factor (ECF subfamily)
MGTNPDIFPFPKASQQESADAVEETGLLARTASGDRDAFRELYSRYSRPLYSFAIRLVGDRGEAEERVQDAFIKMWQNAGSFDPSRSRPFTWAVTITRRTCIDHLRKRRRQVPTSHLAADGGAAREGSDVRDAVGLSEAREDSQRLRQALSEISPRQRAALELALFSELTHSEIAEHLQQPTGTVKSWIRRGLLGLRETLGHPSL